MYLKHEGLLHKGPEFCQALKLVIKLQISTLLQQLAESGEESVVLTANILDGTADHLGSLRGAGFLEDQEQLQKQFLTYCTETRRPSVDDDPVLLPPTSYHGNNHANNHMHSPTLVCHPLVAPHMYQRNEHPRPRYERESSTSDSVFSPNRRKSSASSKSLDEDVAMLSSHEYSDAARSLSESSTTWPEHPSMLSVDMTDKGGTKYTTVRSPTGSRCVDMSEKMEKLSEKIKSASKSPLSENLESIKHISLSSPVEFQYKRHSLPLPSAVPISSPLTNFALQMSTLGKTEQTRVTPTDESKSTGTVSVSPDSEMADPGPMNLVSTTIKSGIMNPPQGIFSPDPSTSLNTFFTYRVPFSTYTEQAGPSQKQNPGMLDTDNNNFYNKQKFENEDLENKYKPPYGPPETMSSQSESFMASESREYQSESGDTYRFQQKKTEAKMYHHQRQGSGSRKQNKGNIERRMSDTPCHSYDLTPPPSATFMQTREKEASPQSHLLQGSDLGEMTPKQSETSLNAGPDLSKSFEEALKVQQTIFHSSLGLLSPLQRQFIPPGRPHLNRERSQSMSEFHSMSAMEQQQLPSGRSRFPSSSYADNLESPLVIDDEMKLETGSQEGLDLSNKKRKMSVDDVYQSTVDEQTDNSNLNISPNQRTESEEQDYERSLQCQNSQGVTSRGGEDPSTKKYGKGNFIKVLTGYQCRICCRVIRHMNNTTAHMRIHANIKPYKCQVCNQQFKYEVDRRYHFSKNHVDLFSKMHFPEEKKTG